MNLSKAVQLRKAIKKARAYFKTNFSLVGNRFWEVRGNGGTYGISLGMNGDVHCTCPSLKFRGDCKHLEIIRIMEEIGEIVAEIPRDDRFTPNKLHLDILTWYRDNAIDESTGGVTTRNMISRIRSREFMHTDQSIRGRTVELEKRGYLRALERTDFNIKLPNNSKYVLTEKGKKVLGGTS